MPRSLRGRLITILVMLAAAAIAAGFVMFALFQQSTSAKIGEAAAVAARSCGAISRAYRFYTTDWHGAAPDLTDPQLRRDLNAVLVTALADKPGIEGGLWQADASSLAYAFPTYEGSGPKTDLPAAELAPIRAANQAALVEDRPQSTRIDSPSQTLLVDACPLSGPIAGLTAWTMTRVHSFGGETYRQLLGGLTILSAAVVAASALAAGLFVTWSRHIGRIETALAAATAGELPALTLTGERELDRVIAALNEAGRRLEASREQAALLSRQIAVGERLVAIGRMAAGIAHEIRNPLAVMRLTAELGSRGDVARKDRAFGTVIAQTDRLDTLVERLLTVSEREPIRIEEVALDSFLSACAEARRASALEVDLTITAEARTPTGRFDPAQMATALDNLLINALQHGTTGTAVDLVAQAAHDRLTFTVSNRGREPEAALQDHLFEPFVTGRAEGTGLGLSIVREVAQAHGGTASFSAANGITTFTVELPWRAS